MDQIYIGNFSKGIVSNRKPYNIDNDAFPYLWNFYVWRGRVKKKRGITKLGQLQLQNQSVATNPLSWQLGPILTLNSSGNGSGTLIGSPIVKGSLNLSDGTNTYTDNQGVITGTPSGSGTINYATGVITISGGASNGVLIGKFSNYPLLPVMGLRDYIKNVPQNDTTGLFRYPLTLDFDTRKAYQFNQNSFPSFFYNISFYKQTENPITWNGQDYQQFWSTNYANAFWATNNVPGMHYLNASYVSGSGSTSIVFNFTTPGGTPFTSLKVGSSTTGDLLWFNQFSNQDVDGVTGYVSATSGSNQYTITFTNSITISSNGIAQMLTNSLPNIDGIRWYDGDPTSNTGLPTATGLGWVNFSPPLTETTTGLVDLPTAQYYLVGAQAIVSFKDRLLFFSPWVQAAAPGSIPINLQDTVIWSWNGTPYYASPTPIDRGYDKTAYYIDQTGKGGYISAGIFQPIVTVNNNEDVLLVGFTGRQARFVFTGNDLDPFAFFTINSELGSSATFSGISLDRGGLTFGTYGLALTTQQSSQRIDLDIPDQVFKVRGLNSGTFRVNSIRDFFREWVYFSFPLDSSPWKFPTQTLLYNYRDATWAILYENFTSHGSFFSKKSKTWQELTYFTWSEWTEPWQSGIDAALFPRVIAGNPQGYVMTLDENTNEDFSGIITNISDNNGLMQITSPNHCVLKSNPGTNDSDYLYIDNVLGLKSASITSISSTYPCVINFSPSISFTIGKFVTITGITGDSKFNNNSYKIVNSSPGSVTLDVNAIGYVYTSAGTITSRCNKQVVKINSTENENTFTTDLSTPEFITSYLGNGEFARLCQPLLQTKQFPFYWEQGRQVRLGTQKYLLDTTENGQVTLNIYLSQDDSTVWNKGPIVPNPNSTNDSLEYSQVLYTCPESTNLGLTPANSNLQTPTALSQSSIWHRINTSLQGETVQIGITLNEEQMKNKNIATSEITLQGIILNVSPGPLLA